MAQTSSAGLPWALAVPQTRHLCFNKQTTSQENGTHKKCCTPGLDSLPTAQGGQTPLDGTDGTLAVAQGWTWP